MLASWLKILPVFLYEPLARKLCMTHNIKGTEWCRASENILIRRYTTGSYHWRTDHWWYRIRFAFWMMQRCHFRVTPAFAWDQATSWDWEEDYTADGPKEHVDVEMSYWDGE